MKSYSPFHSRLEAVDHLLEEKCKEGFKDELDRTEALWLSFERHSIHRVLTVIDKSETIAQVFADETSSVRNEK